MSSPMNFEQLVSICQQTHEEIQKRAVRAVDLSLVVRNWLFGCYIVEFEQNGADRAAYGVGLMDALTARLKPLGIKGISATRLRLYRSFYRDYQQIGQTPSDPLAPEYRAARIQPTPSVESVSAIRPAQHRNGRWGRLGWGGEVGKCREIGSGGWLESGCGSGSAWHAATGSACTNGFQRSPHGLHTMTTNVPFSARQCLTTANSPQLSPSNSTGLKPASG